MEAIFKPRNKGYYKGQHGRRLMSHAGRACKVTGSITHPGRDAARVLANNGEFVTRPAIAEITLTFIKFPNSTLDFQVRPCDVEIIG